MDINDVLIGNESVLVETDEGDFRYDIEDGLVDTGGKPVPEDIEMKLKSISELEFSEFPVEIDFYIHDGADPQDYSIVSDKVGLPEDHTVVERIANIGYEIELTFKVEDESTIFLTHIEGHKLEEPKTIYNR